MSKEIKLEDNSEVETTKKSEADITIFIKVINDFIRDISTTFPEYKLLLDKKSKNMNSLYLFCKKKYPLRSEDIMNRNVEIFDEESEIDTEFLPSVHFKNLWQYDDLSENSKEMIWRYLQLVLLVLRITPDNNNDIVESTNEETMDAMINNMAEFFSNISMGSEKETETEKVSSSSENISSNTFDESHESSSEDPSVPSLDDFGGLFGGHLASLAKDVAAESAALLNLDENTTPDQAIKQLFSNPAKLSSMMSSISSKLDSKMKSGELNQDDIMSEAFGMMGKMGSMPGMGNLFSALSQVEKSPKYNQMSRQEKQKERIRNKLKNKNMK
jgi:hypothetical protein